MTFLLDHDTPDDLAYSLNALGHKAVRLREVLPIRTPTSLELGRALAEIDLNPFANRILISPLNNIVKSDRETH